MKKLTLDVTLFAELKAISIFYYLSDDEKREILNIGELLEYNMGENIITQGETSSCFYAIFSGVVNVTVKDNNGKDIFISSIGKGEFFGEAGIFSNAQRTANVTPASDTAGVFRIDRNGFFEFIRKYPTAGVKILMLFINGLLKKLSESNKELAFTRSNVLDQTAIDSFLQNMK